MIVKSFRLPDEKIEKYNKILEKLRIDGETESDRFRNLIDYLYDYFENGSPAFEETPEPGSANASQKMDALDLVINVLMRHERNLDKIVTRLERVEKPSVPINASGEKAL